ncbi:hypothetical protein BBG47_27230 [Paenibacillus sp. KS1]|uniref:hypothetical protein n=1 Tax=Paenibacillus sp. KS1 TaxID=1849249 RepID=UPI0008065270|nr:hypothetical protein [Paenibacillus sp. KS1]OBY76421.1 hypothetical protein BBG47_27230 [Paenibacillus sp. KS1]
MKQLLFVVLAIFFFTGCTEVKDQTKLKLPTYMEEFNDFSSKMAMYSNFKKETPKHYRLTATIELQRESDADRMLYEIAIRKPTIEMKNVKMTFGLHPKMLQHLLTSNVFNTTDENTPLHLMPDKEPFGLTLGRGHIIDKSLIDHEMLSIYRDMFIKITYESNGKQVIDYLQTEGEVTKELEDYLKQNAVK